MTTSDSRTSVRGLLLTQRGLVFLSSNAEARLSEDQVRAIELEFAALGYVLSTRLRSRLAGCTLDEASAFRAWAVATLAAHVGADQRHEPLFRRFPDGIPADTLALWWQKVLVHFLQADGQPCLFCRRVGTTHVLSPCAHVVCDHCFDGANYSACPVCEHHVDRTSPFFQPTPERPLPNEQVTFKLLDLGSDIATEAEALLVSLCQRTQALSPSDRDALVTIITEYQTRTLEWLPDAIPVRENIATIFGTLFQICHPDDVLPQAKRFMTTATDVLRFIAVLSGTDGSLMRETLFKSISPTAAAATEVRFWGRIRQVLSAVVATGQQSTTAKVARPPSAVSIPLRVNRFKVAKLSRPLRRALLGVLESLNFDSMVEDMLRHRSYWVWVGEFLHPHEYAKRFPKVARGFQIVRKKAPDGTPAPAFRNWYSRLDHALSSGDTDAATAILCERPGEFARRLDHVLRTAPVGEARARVAAAFRQRVPAMATPVLLTLHSHLPTRSQAAPIRIYWPKGRVATGVSRPDERSPLSALEVAPALSAIDAELLRRFGQKPHFTAGLIDSGLKTVIVPFNERTASRSAVSLPRGSQVAVPSGKFMRLFLHWCQPEKDGFTTDIDLSIGFYNPSWEYLGVCAYYNLKAEVGPPGQRQRTVIGKSSGDLRSAPWPDGATEFVDLYCDAARSANVRYAVMVVNNYAGMPFSQLERGFAGLMIRDDKFGKHFDPRTVALKFALDGENGVFLPLVVDLQQSTLYWLDVYRKGQFGMNNVATSNSSITKLCPEMMAYFASGARPTMYDLACLHAAARCWRVFVRTEQSSSNGDSDGIGTNPDRSAAGNQLGGYQFAEFVRRSEEPVEAFYQRLRQGQADEPRSRPPRGIQIGSSSESGSSCSDGGDPLLAFLSRGDIDLPDGSSTYALFRERVIPDTAASDLLS